LSGRRFAALLALFCVICGALGVSAAAEPEASEKSSEEASAKAPEGYEIAARSDEWTLYLRRDTLALIMENNATGARMRSTVPDDDQTKANAKWKAFYRSGIVMEYIQGTVMDYPQVNLVDTPNEKVFDFFDGGFSCEVYYPTLGIAYQATVTLDGNDVCVYIPQSGIREERPSEYTVSSFYVYPFMGYSYLGENGGYMFIPDGQGAIVELEDNEGRYLSPYTATVYGPNVGIVTTTSDTLLGDFVMNQSAERAMIPVYGMAHADSRMAYASVIEEGDVSAAIQASFNGVSNLPFDWITAKYTYRMMYSQQTGPSSGTVNLRTQRAKRFDIRQHFFFLSGDDANYAGMANAYGKFLDEQGVFDRADAARAFDVEIDFVGEERKNGLIGTAAVAMTTFEQAESIISALNADGVAQILGVYKGWNENGITGGRPTVSYDPSGALGGKRGLSQFIETANALNTVVCLDTNLSELVPDTHRMLAYSALKKIDTGTYRRPLYGKVYEGTQLLLTPQKSLELAASLDKDYAANGVRSVSLSGVTELVTDYSFQNTYYDSGDSARFYGETAELLGEERTLALNKPNAYLWRYADMLVDMPIGSSSYRYTTREVPFLAITLAGRMPFYAEYVNDQANSRRFFLQLVEQGARPAFLISDEDPVALMDTDALDIYSSRFELYREMIVSWYKELFVVHEATQGGAITRHAREGDCATVKYENGTTIYINFGQTTSYVGGFALDALSYKVVAANGK
jgi:hypothetical protein